MKKLLLALLLSSLTSLGEETQKAPTFKNVLLEQLRTTHNRKGNWFVPVSVALEGLTPEQAGWKDQSGNHSIGQLANHLAFWNAQELAKFKGEKPAPYNGSNDETFTSFDAKSWSVTVQKLDKVLTEWEQAVEAADDNKLKSWYSTIAHIGTHNAYHIGQIVYVRKLQGSWDASKGIK